MILTDAVIIIIFSPRCQPREKITDSPNGQRTNKVPPGQVTSPASVHHQVLLEVGSEIIGYMTVPSHELAAQKAV